MMEGFFGMFKTDCFVIRRILVQNQLQSPHPFFSRNVYDGSTSYKNTFISGREFVRNYIRLSYNAE